MRASASLLLCGLTVGLSAQELVWDLYSPSDSYVHVMGIGDLDHDGCDDVMTHCWADLRTFSERFYLRILSGRDGSMLYQHGGIAQPGSGAQAALGDWDDDSYPDYAITQFLGYEPVNVVMIWSPRRDKELLRLSGYWANGFGTVLCGNVDLDGDGLLDILVAATAIRRVLAYNHHGTLLYSMPYSPMIALLRAMVPMGDIDGDGADDFALGGNEGGQTRGVVALVSGRTGTVLWTRAGERVGDVIGYPLQVAGDIDGDGHHDLAVGNYWGSNERTLVMLLSGANGNILRQWQSTVFDVASEMVANVDVDLDGIPDVVGSSFFYLNTLSRRGRVHAFSSRDAEILVHTQPRHNTQFYASYLTGLGVQPVSPFPVIAFTEEPNSSGLGGIEVWRLVPPGVRVVGAGCSANGNVPSCGVRRVGGTSSTSRVVLGSAPFGALALGVIGWQSELAFGGGALPVTLEPFGLPGCNLLVAPAVTCLEVTGTTGLDRGYAAFPLPTALAATSGHALAAQWLVLDPFRNRHGVTPRCEFVLQ